MNAHSYDHLLENTPGLSSRYTKSQNQKNAEGPVLWAANTSGGLFIVATLSENQVTAEKLDILHQSSASVQQFSLAHWIGTSIHSSAEVAYPEMIHLIKFETLIKPP